MNKYETIVASAKLIFFSIFFFSNDIIFLYVEWDSFLWGYAAVSSQR